MFDADAVTAYLFHDFVENSEGASVTQVGAVNRARDVLEGTRIAVKCHEGSSDPSTSTLRKTDELNADAICVPGRKWTPADKALFGSVAQGVILGTDRPVLLCSPVEKPEREGRPSVL